MAKTRSTAVATRQSRLTQPAWAALMIGGVAFLVYARSIGNDFIRGYDDDLYVLDNAIVLRGITIEGFLYAWTGTCAANWHPLTMLSHMVDAELFGTAPWGHHLTNVALHAANAALFFLFLHRATGALWTSIAAAALFAVHPIHVENVAHVAQRKDVLSTAFLLLSLLAYVQYASRPSRRNMLFVWLWLTLGLLAKPMLVTAPFALLLLDYWPLRRADLRLRSAIREKWPLIVTALLFCATTLWAQHESRAVASLEERPVFARLENAVTAYVAYVRMLAWPQGLSIFHPHPPDGIAFWKWTGAALGLAAVTIAVLWKRRSQPFLATGWFWYLGTMVPVIGLVQVGAQSMADRYAYVPFLGLYTAMTWWLSWLLDRSSISFRRRAAATAVVTAGFALVTIVTLGHWRDAHTVWSRSLAVAPHNARAHANLATHYRATGDLDLALRHALEAERIEPVARNIGNTASIYFQMDLLDEAEQRYQRALELDPGDSSALYNLCALYLEQNRDADVQKLVTASRVRSAESECTLGRVYRAYNRFDEAERHFRRALELEPAHALAHFGLGAVLEARGQFLEALNSYRAARQARLYFREAAEAIERVSSRLSSQQ